MWLFDRPGPVHPRMLAADLDARHYLGATRRGWGWRDEYGCLVVASPTARHVPATWLELTRWCLNGQPNGGSRQWAAVRRWLLGAFPACTTVVSYSDPAAGHTGSLYRACNWWWAPTWHRVCPPPSGHGRWSEHRDAEGPKDRWVFPLRPDPARIEVLRIEESYSRRFPWSEYREPGGANFAASPFATRRSA